MTGGRWFVQAHPVDGTEPQPPSYFPDFASTLAFVGSFRHKTPSRVILCVHVPSSATDEERHRLRQHGADKVYH
jgi:hypothetical protein